MDALDALQHRFSVPRLVAPGPSEAQREHLFRAALRAPDHGLLRPWRFLTIEGAAREALGELYAKAMAANTSAVSEQALDKARAMPLRAPLLVVVIACVRAHPKVPAQEQVLSAACAAHAILLAAHAQGIGAVWRYGGAVLRPIGQCRVGFVQDGAGRRVSLSGHCATRTAPGHRAGCRRLRQDVVGSGRRGTLGFVSVFI
jgi:hypothetical protein